MIARVRGLVVLLVALMLMSGAARAADAPYTQEQNIVYRETDGIGLVMDVFRPTGASNGLGIVDVASGAWHSDRGKIEDHKKAQFYDIFCARGYTLFAIRPGSRSIYTVPQMVEHLNLGIRYVKAHAADYGVDPNNLGLTGASAGGHLALMVSLEPQAAQADATDSLQKQDTKFAAVAIFFPPTDFLDWNGEMASFDRLGDLLFAGGVEGHTEEEIKQAAEAISPARKPIPADAPPFFIIHGDADPMVPLQQSEKMVKALKDAGVSAELTIKPGGGHPWLTIPEEVKIMADWFDAHLKK
jgi:acetyl esterase/lipase